MHYLQRPYHCEMSIMPRVWRALAFGGFVFLFLALFRPFGLGNLGDHLLPVALGYGLTCTLVMALLNLAFPPLMPRFFDPERYTLGHELGWTVVNIAAIGLANAIYSAWLGIISLNLANLALFMGYTLGVGVFPVAAGIMLHEARQSRRYGQSSAALTSALQSRNHPDTYPETIQLTGGNSGELLSMSANDLLYIQAADNYVEVHHHSEGRVERSILRGTLKQMEGQLSGKGNIFRCHKSYLVNLDHVVRVSGNAQGFRLHLAPGDEGVPVSRQHNATIRQRLTVGP
jgi:hypothetical protein